MCFPIHNVPETFDEFIPEFIDVGIYVYNVYNEEFIPEFIDDGIYTYIQSGPVFSCARRRRSPAGRIAMHDKYDTRAGQCSAALAAREIGK